MDTIKEKIYAIMSNVFEVSVNEISEDSSFDSIESWDSIRHLNLILALEEEFGITIPDEEVGNLINYKLIELTVNEQLKQD